MKTKKRKKTICFTALLCATCLFMSGFSNTRLDTTYYEIKSEKITEEMSGFKIAHISDFHDSKIGEKIVEKVKAELPDMIALTGDMVDSNRYFPERTMEMIRELAKIAPCYYVNGNHEAHLDSMIEDGSVMTKYQSFELQLIECGVTVLRNETVTIDHNGKKINIVGIRDPNIKKDGNILYTEMGYMDLTLERTEWPDDKDNFTILLTHRPEYLMRYISYKPDLVLAGHIHGGQFRIFGKGLYSPVFGWFPSWTSGYFYLEDEPYPTQMIVSRGIGNSVFPIRFNNNPELVIVTLDT